MNELALILVKSVLKRMQKGPLLWVIGAFQRIKSPAAQLLEVHYPHKMHNARHAPHIMATTVLAALYWIKL